MSCKSCNHWKKHDHSAYENWAGWCRRNPPVIVSAICAEMPGSEPRDMVVRASHWPVTRADDECGEWQGQMPC